MLYTVFGELQALESGGIPFILKIFDNIVDFQHGQFFMNSSQN